MGLHQGCHCPTRCVARIECKSFTFHKRRQLSATGSWCALNPKAKPCTLTGSPCTRTKANHDCAMCDVTLTSQWPGDEIASRLPLPMEDLAERECQTLTTDKTNLNFLHLIKQRSDKVVCHAELTMALMCFASKMSYCTTVSVKLTVLCCAEVGLSYTGLWLKLRRCRKVQS